MDSLVSLPEFKSMPKLREKLSAYGIVKTFEAGDVIINEHDNIRSIPIVLSGSMGVTRSDDDYKEILLYYIKPGESCIMSFLGGIHHETSKLKATIEEKTEILFIPIERVGELIKEFPEWLDYIFRLYHKRFEELLEVVNAVAFKHMDERLMNLIKMKSNLAGSITVQITHEQLAHELGTARVVVSRILKQLEEVGRVKLGRNKITLV